MIEQKTSFSPFPLSLFLQPSCSSWTFITPKQRLANHCTTYHNHLDFAGPLTWLYPSRDPPYLNLPPCYRTNICLCSSRSFSLHFHIPIPFSCSKTRVRHFALSCISCGGSNSIGLILALNQFLSQDRSMGGRPLVSIKSLFRMANQHIAHY